MNEEFMPQSDSDLTYTDNSQNESLSKLSEVNDIIKSSDFLVKSLSLTVTTVCSTVEDIKKISAQVEIEIAKMDHMIDALMIKAQRDIEIYKTSLPVLNEQFNRFQSRLDMLMTKAMDMVSSDFSENALARSEFALTLIDKTNEHLSKLIEKLIPQY